MPASGYTQVTKGAFCAVPARRPGRVLDGAKQVVLECIPHNRARNKGIINAERPEQVQKKKGVAMMTATPWISWSG